MGGNLHAVADEDRIERDGLPGRSLSGKSIGYLIAAGLSDDNARGWAKVIAAGVITPALADEIGSRQFEAFPRSLEGGA